MAIKMNPRGNIQITLIIIATLAIGIILYFKFQSQDKNIFYGVLSDPTNQSASKDPQQTQAYQSKLMHLIIHVSPSFKIEDKNVSIDLYSVDGKISIVRNGTNFDNLDEYIMNFDSKRKLTSSEMERLLIDNHYALSRIVEFPEEKVKQKSYYIYIDNMVYIFSTSSESLYDDLDQIAKSFKYIP